MKGLVKYGEIWKIDLGERIGSEQGGVRPCLILQNDVGNEHSTTTIICPISSKIYKCRSLHPHISGLPKPSVVLCEQITTVDTSRFISKVSDKIADYEMETIKKCIRRVINID